MMPHFHLQAFINSPVTEGGGVSTVQYSTGTVQVQSVTEAPGLPYDRRVLGTNSYHNYLFTSSQTEYNLQRTAL